VLGLETETVLVDGPPPAGHVGETPWSSARPIVYDMAAAEKELGCRPVTGYAESLPETVEWLAARLDGRDWQDAFPAMLRAYGEVLFDCSPEDAWLEWYDRGL
jgi:hypothetical protein